MHGTRTGIAALPGLTGRGVLLADPAAADAVRRTLTRDGFTVAEVVGEAAHVRGAQAAIAQALRLPQAAARDLDALVTALRELPTWWPDDQWVALLWPGAGRLVESDLPGFLTLVGVLSTVTDDQWREGGPGNRQFETVAFVDQHGIGMLLTGARARGPRGDQSQTGPTSTAVRSRAASRGPMRGSSRRK